MARAAKELNSGATDGLSESKRSTNLRIGAADTRSNSGPSGATFLLSSFPTRPLTREVISHGETRDCHLEDGVCINQISNWVVGRIRSSASIVTSPAKYETSAIKAAHDVSTPRWAERTFRSRTPKPPERSASAGSCAQKFRISSVHLRKVVIFAIAANCTLLRSRFSVFKVGSWTCNSLCNLPPRSARATSRTNKTVLVLAATTKLFSSNQATPAPGFLTSATVPRGGPQTIASSAFCAAGGASSNFFRFNLTTVCGPSPCISLPRTSRTVVGR